MDTHQPESRGSRGKNRSEIPYTGWRPAPLSFPAWFYSRRFGFPNRRAPANPTLAARARRVHVSPMVFAEIKPQIEQLPHGEQLKAIAFLKHLLRADSPDYQRELAQRHADIEAGKKISLTDAKRRLE